MKSVTSIAFAILVLFGGQAESASTEQTNDVNSFIDAMMKGQDAAFVTACAAHSESKEFLARIVFFPRRNKGLFIFSDGNGVVLNYGSLSWTSAGQWDMGDLEGGIQTVKVMSDLFYQLTRGPFTWTSPQGIKLALTEPSKYTCKLMQ